MAIWKNIAGISEFDQEFAQFRMFDNWPTQTRHCFEQQKLLGDSVGSAP